MKSRAAWKPSKRLSKIRPLAAHILIDRMNQMQNARTLSAETRKKASTLIQSTIQLYFLSENLQEAEKLQETLLKLMCISLRSMIAVRMVNYGKVQKIRQEKIEKWLI